MTIDGTTSSINAGNYNVTFTPKTGYTWPDKSTGSKTVSWTIEKANGSFSIDKTNISLNSGSISETITATVIGDGIVTAMSSDTTIATTSVSENIITINSVNKKSGQTTVTISISETNNYTAPDNQTISVDCQFINIPLKTFSDATDEEIIQMVQAADAGQIDLTEDCGWEVGQEHTITLPAIAASGIFDEASWTVSETQPEQRVTLVLMDTGGNQTFNLVSPVKDKDGNDRTKPEFIVGLKNSLSVNGYINSYGGSVSPWSTSERRKLFIVKYKCRKLQTKNVGRCNYIL